MKTSVAVSLLPLFLWSQQAEPEALISSATTKMQAKEFRAAAADLTRAIELGGKSTRACSLRGSCRAALGEAEDAVVDFTDAIALGERGLAVYVARGKARFQTGDARGTISDLSEEDPTDAEILACRGHAYFALDSWANALRDFRAASVTDPGRTESLRAAVWLARAHLGERDAATRELVARLPEGWRGLMARYLCGTLSEEGLLQAVSREPEASRAEARAAAWHTIGSRRRLDGMEDPDAFRKALQGSSGSAAYDVVARMQLAAWSVRDARKILEGQDARLKALRRFHAEFRLQILPPVGKDGVATDECVLSLDVDRENERAFQYVPKETKRIPDGLRLLFENNSILTWTDGTRASDPGYHTMLASFARWDSTAVDELNQLVPSGLGIGLWDPGVMILALELERKPSAAGEGVFRFYVGRGIHPCSWTRLEKSDRETTVREQGDDILIEHPSLKERVLVEKASGVPKLIEVTDYDGKRRQLVRTAFSVGDPFPSVKVPEKVVPVTANSFQSVWVEFRERALAARMLEVLSRWDRVQDVGKEKEVARILAAWVTELLDQMRQFQVHCAARRYIKNILDHKVSWAEVHKEADLHLKHFKPWAAKTNPDVGSFVRGQLRDLGRQVTTEILEVPLDSRLHPALRRLRRAVFDVDAVEAALRSGEAATVERIFREELEAARQL
jgi:tetratricopeptide (TPR) repeat protein